MSGAKICLITFIVTTLIAGIAAFITIYSITSLNEEKISEFAKTEDSAESTETSSSNSESA